MASQGTPWQTARYHTAKIPIANNNTRQISVTVAGRKRSPASDNAPLQPLVILEAGLGGVSAEFVVVAQLISSFARVLRYDRAGYGASTFSNQPDAISTAESCQTLSLVLEAIDLPPPYILVGQSYGGILAREFLQQRGPKDVVGMVLVDSIPLGQRMDVVRRLIPVFCGDGTGDAYGEAIGLMQNAVLTPLQDAERRESEKIAEENGTIDAEAKVVRECAAALNEAEGMESTIGEDGIVTSIKYTKQPLDRGRLSVIVGDFPRDWSALVDYAKKHGHGDEEEFREAAALLDLAKTTVYAFQEAMAALTAGESRIVRASGTGRTHDLHLTRPDIVAKEVKWVMAGAWDLGDDEI